MQTINLTASEAAGRDPASTDSITRIVWQAALPRGCSKIVLACLAWHAARNPHDQCWPHVDTIARLCGI